jgi:hypothetical protein
MYHLIFQHAMVTEGEPTYLGNWELAAIVIIAFATVSMIMVALRSDSDLSSYIWPVLGLGIAVIFLTHALIAFQNPSEYLEPLEHNSAIQSTHLSPVTILTIVRISDISLTILFAITFVPRYARSLGPCLVAAYASCWISMAAYMSGPGEFYEHVAYLLFVIVYACLAIETRYLESE